MICYYKKHQDSNYPQYKYLFWKEGDKFSIPLSSDDLIQKIEACRILNIPCQNADKSRRAHSTSLIKNSRFKAN